MKTLESTSGWTFRVDLNGLRNGNRLTASLASAEESIAAAFGAPLSGSAVTVVDDEDTVADAKVLAVRAGVVDLEIDMDSWRDRSRWVSQQIRVGRGQRVRYRPIEVRQEQVSSAA
jgi:hypothetical protein